MNLLDFSAGQGVHAWSSKIFVVAIAFTVLAYGSVAEAPFYLAAIIFALLAGISILRPIGSVAVGRLDHGRHGRSARC